MTDVRSLRSRLCGLPFMALARLAGAGAGFLAQLMLARLLPADGIGVFFAATSFAAVLGLLSAQGYSGILQRFMTRYRGKGRSDLLGAFVAQVEREVLMTVTVVAANLGAAAFLLPGLGSDMRTVVAAAAVCTVAAGAFSIYPVFACVDRRFALGLLPETLLRPVVFLALLGAAAIAGVALTAGRAVAAYAVVSALLALAQFAALRRTLPTWRTLKTTRLAVQWRREGRPLVLVALFTTLFADLAILLASLFLNVEGLAAFGVALKIAMLIGFVVQVAHQISLPDIAETHQRRDTRGLRKALLGAVFLPTGFTLAALAGSVAWGDRALALFGPEFAAAKWSLVILIAAQCVRAIAGPTTALLTLKGAQGTNAAISLACCIVLLAANAVLVPVLGILGASLAVLLTVLAWTGASGVILWQRSGIRADLFSIRRPRRHRRLHAAVTPVTPADA